MDNFFCVVGAIVIVLIALAFTAGVFALMFAALDNLAGRWRHDIIYRRDAEIGETLKMGARYMSDSPELESLLRFLGEHIQGGYSLYAGHWRDGFERYRATAPVAAPPDAGKP